jgi:ketosteroid isomerase-like protein
MKSVIATSVFCAAALAASTAPASATPADDAQIKVLYDQFTRDFNAKDVDAIMKLYAPGKELLVFDVVPPRQYSGWDAYRKDWQDFFAGYKGALKFTISDLSYQTSGNLGFGHSIQRVVGTDTKGNPSDMTVRVTDVYRRIGSKWLIVHEHVSIPVNLDTGKADMHSMP